MTCNQTKPLSLRSTCKHTRKNRHASGLNENGSNHIFELRIKIELYEDHRSEGIST